MSDTAWKQGEQPHNKIAGQRRKGKVVKKNKTTEANIAYEMSQNEKIDYNL